MIANLAGAAAGCTGTWAQRWKCGWNQPVSPAVGHAGSGFGHVLLSALAVVLVVFLLVRVTKRRKKGRPSPAGARR